MRRALFIFLMAGSATVASTAAETNATVTAPQPTTTSAEGPGFEDFKIITQRNIFDPNRSAPGAPRRTVETPRPKRIEFLNLVGAMSYEKGQFAFFDGSNSEHRKSVKPGDSIAGYKIAEVSQNQVTLQRGDTKVQLPVGGQLKREDEGEWRVNENPEPFGASQSSSNSPASPEPGQSSSSSTNSINSSDQVNPILKRLLEQRRQGR